MFELLKVVRLLHYWLAFETCRYYHPDERFDTLFQLVKNAGKKNLEMEESKKRDMTGLTAYANQALQYAAAVQAGLIFPHHF